MAAPPKPPTPFPPFDLSQFFLPHEFVPLLTKTNRFKHVGSRSSIINAFRLNRIIAEHGLTRLAVPNFYLVLTRSGINVVYDGLYEDTVQGEHKLDRETTTQLMKLAELSGYRQFEDVTELDDERDVPRPSALYYSKTTKMLYLADVGNSSFSSSLNKTLHIDDHVLKFGDTVKIPNIGNITISEDSPFAVVYDLQESNAMMTDGAKDLVAQRSQQLLTTKGCEEITLLPDNAKDYDPRDAKFALLYDDNIARLCPYPALDLEFDVSKIDEARRRGTAPGITNPRMMPYASSSVRQFKDGTSKAKMDAAFAAQKRVEKEFELFSRINVQKAHYPQFEPPAMFEEGVPNLVNNKVRRVKQVVISLKATDVKTIGDKIEVLSLSDVTGMTAICRDLRIDGKRLSALAFDMGVGYANIMFRSSVRAPNLKVVYAPMRGSSRQNQLWFTDFEGAQIVQWHPGKIASETTCCLASMFSQLYAPQPSGGVGISLWCYFIDGMSSVIHAPMDLHSHPEIGSAGLEIATAFDKFVYKSFINLVLGLFGVHANLPPNFSLIPLKRQIFRSQYMAWAKTLLKTHVRMHGFGGTGISIINFCISELVWMFSDFTKGVAPPSEDHAIPLIDRETRLVSTVIADEVRATILDNIARNFLGTQSFTAK